MGPEDNDVREVYDVDRETKIHISREPLIGSLMSTRSDRIALPLGCFRFVNLLISRKFHESEAPLLINNYWWSTPPVNQLVGGERVHHKLAGHAENGFEDLLRTVTTILERMLCFLCWYQMEA